MSQRAAGARAGRAGGRARAAAAGARASPAVCTAWARAASCNKNLIAALQICWQLQTRCSIYSSVLRLPHAERISKKSINRFLESNLCGIACSTFSFSASISLKDLLFLKLFPPESAFNTNLIFLAIKLAVHLSKLEHYQAFDPTLRCHIINK